MSQPEATERSQQQKRPPAAAYTRPPDNSKRLAPVPMDPLLSSIQPGGGVIIRLELAWGSLRRWYLSTFRRRYVERMRRLRQGDFNGCPHPVLDPRDLKFFRNQGGYFWRPGDDPFRWRDRLPFARDGLAELLLGSVVAFGGAGMLGWMALHNELVSLSAGLMALLAAGFAVAGLLIVWFFRDPPRRIPRGEGLVLSPADGKIVAIEELAYDEFIGGPAVTVGIFLSIFNAHVNRMPAAARVVGLRYHPGKCLNALRPESARENEQLAVRIETERAGHRRMVVRQITGAIARRIVCAVKPGDCLAAGERFGMIKFGSRTELVLPRERALKIRVQVGASVRAGSSVLAEYETCATTAERQP